MLRLLRKKPENRFASCGELRDALRKVASGAPPVDVPRESLIPLSEGRLMSAAAAGRSTAKGQLLLLLGIALVSAGVATVATVTLGGRAGAQEEVELADPGAAPAAPEPATPRAR